MMNRWKKMKSAALSVIIFRVSGGEMKTYSHLLRVIKQYNQGSRLSFLSVGEVYYCLRTLYVGYSMDVLGSQAISISQASWINSRQEQKYLEDSVLSLAGIEETAADCRFGCQHIWISFLSPFSNACISVLHFKVLSRLNINDWYSNLGNLQYAG